MSSCCESEKKCCGKNCSVTVAVVVVCLIFAALVWKTRQYTTPPVLGAERAAERAKALAELRAAESDALNTVGWVDQAKGIVRLPIADAVNLAEKQWQNPAQARATLNDRVEKAFFVPPPPPPKPSAFE
ncbi:MAG: hypothetical protein QM813_07920 [Verrucomicrobiota bacterium]